MLPSMTNKIAASELLKLPSFYHEDHEMWLVIQEWPQNFIGGQKPELDHSEKTAQAKEMFVGGNVTVKTLQVSQS